MEYFPAALEKLVEQFARLPGIGGKSAQRLAFHVLAVLHRHDVRKPELYAGQRQQRREKGLQIGERERQRGKHGAGRDGFR